MIQIKLANILLTAPEAGMRSNDGPNRPSHRLGRRSFEPTCRSAELRLKVSFHTCKHGTEIALAGSLCSMYTSFQDQTARIDDVKKHSNDERNSDCVRQTENVNL